MTTRQLQEEHQETLQGKSNERSQKKRQLKIQGKSHEKPHKRSKENLQGKSDERPYKKYQEKILKRLHEKLQKREEQLKPLEQINCQDDQCSSISEETTLMNTVIEKKPKDQNGVVETKNAKQIISNERSYSTSVEVKELSIAKSCRKLETESKKRRNSFSSSEENNSLQRKGFAPPNASWENLALKINNKDHKELKRPNITDRPQQEHNIRASSVSMLSSPVGHTTTRPGNENKTGECQLLLDLKELERKKNQLLIKSKRAKELYKLMLNYGNR